MTKEELAKQLVELVDNELWETIIPSAWDDSGLGINFNKEKFYEKVLNLLVSTRT